MDYQKLAEIALEGRVLEREQCHAVLGCSEDRILELLQAAFRVRERYFGRRVTLHLLINAKSGLCSEDCSYCSQSAVSQAAVEKYPLLDEEKVLGGARAARAAKAKRYCIVTSGYTLAPSELERLCRVAGRIKREVGIELCVSPGFLTEEAARRLKQAGVDRYNHNLNTSERYYSRICTTHGYQDRVRALQYGRGAGLELCCGVLFGMGESDDDIVDACLALRELGPDSIPVNFLHPIAGTPSFDGLRTPLEGMAPFTPVRCLAILSLVRFLNPSTEVRVAGGREHNLRSLQPLALYPANSIFVSGYLTTSGQSPQEAWQMIADMGFEVEQEAVGEAGVRLG
ncbi:MAG: biotin synthase BioB [Actinomycetota bacterium]